MMGNYFTTVFAFKFLGQTLASVDFSINFEFLIQNHLFFIHLKIVLLGYFRDILDRNLSHSAKLKEFEIEIGVI